MINPLQATAPFGNAVNTLQEQVQSTQARGDIRTDNQQRQQSESVRAGQEGSAALPYGSNQAPKTGKSNATPAKSNAVANSTPANPNSEKVNEIQEEEKNKGAVVKEEKRKYPPPAPTPFELVVQAQQEKYVNTQKAVVQYFLSAGAATGSFIRPEGWDQPDPEQQKPGGGITQPPSVDVKV